MGTTVNLWPLIGVAVIIAGSVLRFNPMLVMAVAVIATGFTASMSIEQILIAIGTGIIRTRALPLIILLPLAMMDLSEHHSSREHAWSWIACIRSATVGRLLIVYLAARKLTAATGLTNLGGRPQMMRPLLAPTAEGVAENRFGKLSVPMYERLLAFCIAADSVDPFFGEDIFVAFDTIVLMYMFLPGSGIDVEPLRIAAWSIPTVVCAFLIHSVRLKRLDGWPAREMGNQRGVAGNINTVAAKQG